MRRRHRRNQCGRSALLGCLLRGDTIREFIIEVVLVDGSDISISMLNSQDCCRFYFNIIEYAMSILTAENIY